jgi:hypothetical protein
MKITEARINGDFRSEDCTTLLKQADIVVTNPPFSLFRDFFKWLMDNDKKFIIVGNQNAISYKEIFPYLKNNIVRIGSQTAIKRQTFFETTLSVGDMATKEVKRAFSEEYLKEHSMTAVTGVCWFTNCDLKKHHEPLFVYQSMMKINILNMIIMIL